MIPNTLTLQHERVDDIPLLLGLMQQLHLPETLERSLGSHHLHQGISNGWLAVSGWPSSSPRPTTARSASRTGPRVINVLSKPSSGNPCALRNSPMIA